MGKKTWCCSHHGRACDPYDCMFQLDYCQTAWSQDKRRFCVQHKHVVCPKRLVTASLGPAGSSNFNCTAGYANWEQGWSIAKKAWCCKNDNRGCYGRAFYDQKFAVEAQLDRASITRGPVAILASILGLFLVFAAMAFLLCGLLHRRTRYTQCSMSSCTE